MSENFTENLPEKFIRNVLDVCGDRGKQWLSELPQIIKEIAEKWQIKTKKPFENLSYNFVAACVFESSDEAVLKIALPLNNLEIFNEANYLQIQNGKGAARVLNFDESRRAMLLEKLNPGKPLKMLFSGNESRTVEIAVGLIKKLLRRPPAGTEFILLEKWFGNFFERAVNTDFPTYYLSKTREIFDELSSSEKYLIHGDFHHENILSAEREPFLVIDPKGVIGNIGYEIAVFLNNHLWWLSPEKNCVEKLERAVRQFSEAFDISPDHLKKWAFAQMVLSAWWTFEDNGENWESELAFAEFWKV